MTAELWFILLIVLAYFVGSIPFGLVVAKSRGIDPREHGSGNIGATNVSRLLGRKYFWIIMLLDAAKSALLMVLGKVIVWQLLENHQKPVDFHIYLLWGLVGGVAVLGNMFSVYIKFKGGKGVATSMGVVVGLFPYYTLPAICTVATFGIVFQIWRYISLASIVAVIIFPISYIVIGGLRGWPVFHEQLPLLVIGCAMPIMILYRHRSNMVRLWNGTENKSERKKKNAGPETA